jgi:hypothetical protein
MLPRTTALGPCSARLSLAFSARMIRSPISLARSVEVRALGDSNDNRPKLTRENEPEEYWTSERERAGKSAFSDPVALIGILAIFFPIILLLILSALGVVDLTPQ